MQQLLSLQPAMFLSHTQMVVLLDTVVWLCLPPVLRRGKMQHLELGTLYAIHTTFT